MGYLQNCFVVKEFDESSWLSRVYFFLCQDGIHVWNHFAFTWIVFAFVQLFSLMWGRYNCVLGMLFRLHV